MFFLATPAIPVTSAPATLTNTLSLNKMIYRSHSRQCNVTFCPVGISLSCSDDVLPLSQS